MKYLPLSFLVQLDKPFSEYPEVKKKILEIDPIEYCFKYVEDYLEIDKGYFYTPFSRNKEEYAKFCSYPIISLEEFMTGEYPLIKLGEIGGWTVNYNKEKGIITAGCQTVTLAEMRQIKNQLDNNIEDSLELQCGSVAIFDDDYVDRDSFIIMDAGERYVIRGGEFMEIYSRLNLSAEPESNETGQ